MAPLFTRLASPYIDAENVAERRGATQAIASFGMNLDCNCVHGVGQTSDISFGIDEAVSDAASSSVAQAASEAVSSGFFSSIGDFFSHGWGESLLKGGLSIGTAYAASQLTGGGGGTSSGGTVWNPGGTVANTQPGAAAGTQAGGLPAWVLPVAIGGGLGLLALAILSMRRR